MHSHAPVVGHSHGRLRFQRPGESAGLYFLAPTLFILSPRPVEGGQIAVRRKHQVNDECNCRIVVQER